MHRIARLFGLAATVAAGRREPHRRRRVRRRLAGRRPRLRQQQHAPARTRSPASIATPTARSRRSPARRSTPAAPAPAPRSARPAGSRRRPTAATSSRPTRRATRSPSCGSSRTARSSSSRSRTSNGRTPDEHRGPRQPRLRRERRRRRQQLHRLPAECRRPPDADRRTRPFALPDNALPGPRPDQPRRPPPRRRRGSGRTPVRRSSTAFRIGADGRLTAAPGSPFAAQRIGPFGSAFSPTTVTSCSSRTPTTARAPARCRSTTSPRTAA